ncbi:hypothetical protein D3C85_1179570 [compost metagenome]
MLAHHHGGTRRSPRPRDAARPGEIVAERDAKTQLTVLFHPCDKLIHTTTVIFCVPAAKLIERRFQNHHLRQRHNRHEVIALRSSQRVLQLLQLRHRAVHAELTAVHFNDRHHARLIQVDTQTLRPFRQCRRVLFSLNQVHHQFFAQAAVLSQKMHQTRLFQHHLGGHTHQLTVFAQGFRFASQTDNADDFPFQSQR